MLSAVILAKVVCCYLMCRHFTIMPPKKYPPSLTRICQNRWKQFVINLLDVAVEQCWHAAVEAAKLSTVRRRIANLPVASQAA